MTVTEVVRILLLGSMGVRSSALATGVEGEAQ